MKDLDKFEDMFMILCSSLATFSDELENQNFKDGDVKMLKWQSQIHIENLQNEIFEKIEQIRRITA